MGKGAAGVTRISTQASTAPAVKQAPAALPRLDLFDVVQEYASEGLRREPCIRRILRRFATNSARKLRLSCSLTVMNKESDMAQWAVILAGGEGRRMQSLIENWLGAAVPKQFCTFCGTRSMLQHTLDRAKQLVEPSRVLTVIGSGQRRFHRQIENPGSIIEQPAARGTLGGILLPASYVAAVDASALLYILPADHFIFPEERFIEVLKTAAAAAITLDKVVLVGANPDGGETDYGWIQKGSSPIYTGAAGAVYEICSFSEKPSKKEASAYFRRGWLWNTLVMTARLETLWSLMSELYPGVTEAFQAFSRSLRSGFATRREEMKNIRELYARIASLDFSRDFLEEGPDKAAVIALTGAHWSDWGRPERVIKTLHRLGHTIPWEAEPRAATRPRL